MGQFWFSKNNLTMANKIVAANKDLGNNEYIFCLIKTIEDLPNEVWKDIDGFNGVYQVSNLGRIKSTERISGKYYPSTIISQQKDNFGYLRCRVSKKSDKKTIKVHREVAKAFIENPLNKREVNHKNGIKNDNRIDNLEWDTPSENQIHAIANKLKIPKKGKDAYWYGKKHSLESKIKIGIGAKGRKHTEDVKIKMSIDRMYKAPNSLKVINKDTGEIYNSITEAADKNNISRRVINYGIKTKKFNLEILK